MRCDELFGQLWKNTDSGDAALARQVLAGRYTWLEQGVMDPSIPGPWVAETAAGPVQAGKRAPPHRLTARRPARPRESPLLAMSVRFRPPAPDKSEPLMPVAAHGRNAGTR